MTVPTPLGSASRGRSRARTTRPATASTRYQPAEEREALDPCRTSRETKSAELGGVPLDLANERPPAPTEPRIETAYTSRPAASAGAPITSARLRPRNRLLLSRSAA